LFPSPSLFPSLSSLLLPSPTLTSLRAADVPLLRCHHYRSIHAAATALPPLHCAPQLRRRQAAADVVLLRCRHHQHCVVAQPPLRLTLLLPPRHCQAGANVVLLRCCHRQCRFVVLPPPPLTPPPPPRRRAAAKLPPTSHLPLLIVIFPVCIRGSI
jgi:hypothetical protein